MICTDIIFKETNRQINTNEQMNKAFCLRWSNVTRGKRYLHLILNETNNIG